MIIKNKYSLTYCTNIFKEKNWKTLFKELNGYTSVIKKYLKKNMYMGLGLCLSNRMANELIKKNNIFSLKNWLKKEKVYINSFNGFVYKTFHTKKIKENIYLPDWTSEKREKYTLNLINILSELMNKKFSGSISTSPISYKKWVKKRYNPYIFLKSSRLMSKIIKILNNIKNNTYIHLDIEPEPRCTIETVTEIINFFNFWLIPSTVKLFKNKKAKKLVYKYIKLCYDICHFSVNFEDQKKLINILKKSNIKIGKIQVTSALKIIIKKKQNNVYNTKILNMLNNSKFLHQTSEKKNKIKKYNDFKDISGKLENKYNTEIRIHCHVPLYIKKIDFMETTQNETILILKLLMESFNTKHIEIETYTHNMLLKEKQINSIVNEYKWIIGRLK